MKIEFKDLDISTLLGEQAGAILISSMEKAFQQYFERLATKEWLSVKEACEYIGVSFNTFAKFREKGLPVCEIDGIKRVSKRSIDEFLKNNSY